MDADLALITPVLDDVPEDDSAESEDISIGHEASVEEVEEQA